MVTSFYCPQCLQAKPDGTASRDMLHLKAHAKSHIFNHLKPIQPRSLASPFGVHKW